MVGPKLQGIQCSEVMPRLALDGCRGRHDCPTYTGMDVFPFEDLVLRPSEPIGTPSLYFLPTVAQLIILTMLMNLWSQQRFLTWFGSSMKLSSVSMSLNETLKGVSSDLCSLMLLEKVLRVADALEKLSSRECLFRALRYH